MTVTSTSKPIDIPTFEQIATIVSDLVVNYGNMAQTYYDMFYNQTPMDISLTLFDGAGVLRDYVIPNRAKDFRYCRNGKGSPEGVVSAEIGSIYQDTENGNLYIKKIGNSATGWQQLSTSDVVEQGYGTPEGRLSRPKGTLFVDVSSGNLYIKTTSTGVIGWSLISANTTLLADTSLSNLTAEGANRFTDRDFSNISNIARSTFANPNLTNLSASGEKHFLNKGQVSNIILEDAGGITESSDHYTITVPAGFKVLIPNGREADGTLRNIEYVVPSDIVQSVPNTFAGRVCMFLLGDNTLSLSCPKERYFIGGSAPNVFSASHTDAVWFNTRSNYIEHTTDSGENWNAFYATFVGEVNINTIEGGTHGYVVSISPERPTRLLSNADSSYISGCGAPSTYTLNFSVGQSGEGVTAPMDGYFTFGISTGDRTKRCDNLNTTCATYSHNRQIWKLTTSSHGADVSNVDVVLPVSKGDLFTYFYGINNSQGHPITLSLSFIANKGEVDSIQ